jgi:hypothetical protein
MNKISKALALLMFSASIGLISACSSSDSVSSGSTTPTINTDPATIDASNTQAIGVSSGEGVRVATAEFPTAITTTASSSGEINDAVKSIADSIVTGPSLATGVDISAEYCSSGTADVTSVPENATSGPVTITITFSNCVLSYGEGEKVDGTSVVYYADIADPFNSAFSISYTNFTYTDIDGKSTTIPDYTFECDGTNTATSCTITASFVGSDGVTSQITDLDTPNGTFPPITGTATFYHGTEGKVTISFSGLDWGACGAVPVAGSITFTSEDGSEGNIAFSTDCTQTGTWANSTGNGSY